MGDDAHDNSRVLVLDDRTAHPTVATLVTAICNGGRWMTIEGAPTTWVLREGDVRRGRGRPTRRAGAPPGPAGTGRAPGRRHVLPRRPGRALPPRAPRHPGRRADDRDGPARPGPAPSPPRGSVRAEPRRLPAVPRHVRSTSPAVVRQPLPTASRIAARPSTVVCERYASPEALTASIAASVFSSPARSRKTTSDSDGAVTISKRSSAATRAATCSARAMPLRMWARSPSSP